MLRLTAGTLFLLSAGAGIAGAQLRGHGGPVRALAVSPDGASALPGSFDTSVIRWSLPRNAADQVLRFHDGAVDAVRLLGGRPHCTARRGRPHRDLAARRAKTGRPCCRPHGADGRARRLPRRRKSRLGVLGSHRAAVAARGPASRACSTVTRKASTALRSLRTANRAGHRRL